LAEFHGDEVQQVVGAGVYMSDRPPKHDFHPKLRPYGKLDISAELVVCAVHQGRLIPQHYPTSWEDAVTKVGTAEAHARLRAYADRTRTKEYQEEFLRWNPKRKYVDIASYPTPTLLMGLNADRDAYEIVYDPHDLGGQIDPMMLLNFRRRV
jgi:hypothetical protein